MEKITAQEKKYLENLGLRIAKHREGQGLSRDDLAKRIGLSRMHMHRIEKALNLPNLIVLRRIAKELGLRLSELLG